MIGLAFVIAGALLILSAGGFVLGLLLAAFGRWKAEHDTARALRWWESLTADDRAAWEQRIGPPSQANVLRAWDAHRAEPPL